MLPPTSSKALRSLRSHSGSCGPMFDKHQTLISLLGSERKVYNSQTVQLEKNNTNRQLFLFSYVIIGVLIASAFIQCINSEKSKKEDDDNGHPCICNGTFYKSCPKASECSENTYKSSHLPKRKFKHAYHDQFDAEGLHGKLNLHNLNTNLLYGSDSNAHDDSHPDHVDIPPLFHGSANSGLEDERYSSFDSTSGLGASIGAFDSDTDTQRIVRHRKVYVSKKDKKVPIMNPITITIPLKLPEDETPLPPPKPLFQYKKYTTYETKPEIHMVPVTKTIIRPADVSSDQIVDENGQKVTKDFDAKKL